MTSSIEAPPLKGSGIPLHRQLFLCLRDRIFRGIYPPGSGLPNEAQLGETFQVSRITVRRALADLELKGLVVRKQRLGTFVHPDFQPARQSATLAFLDALKQTALETQGARAVLVQKEQAPPDIAALLGLEQGELAQHTRRVRELDGVPIVATEAWAPAQLLRGVSETALRKQLLYQLLLAQGIAFGRVVQEITAEAADPLHAELLQTEVGAPLLRITRLLHSTEAQPVQHLTARSSPEHSRILMDVSAEAINSLSAGALTHDAEARLS